MSLTNIRTEQDGTEIDLLNYFYPVGTIIESFDSSFDPNSIWGGTWVKISDRFLYGVSDSSCVGKCGGSSSITLCSCNIPSVDFTFGGYTCVYNGCSYATSYPAGTYCMCARKSGLGGAYTGIRYCTLYMTDTNLTYSLCLSGVFNTYTCVYFPERNYATDGCACAFEVVPQYYGVNIWQKTSD